ncbi:hypothetical protein BH11CYA1_BH11CYA1_01250 [soil metagenome]
MATLEPKAINPPVWLLSALAIAVGFAYTSASLNFSKPSLPVQLPLYEQVAEVAEQNHEELPTVQHNLGQYLYQYFAANTNHQAYFRLLDGESETARYSQDDVAYNLLPVTACDLTPYEDRQSGQLVLKIKNQKIIVVEQIASSEQTADQHRYLVIALAAPAKPLRTLDTGTNQFSVEYRRHGDNKNQSSQEQYQLIGCDQLDAWGQQPVSPKVTFDLDISSDNKASLNLHKSKRRSKEELLVIVKGLKKQFADLDISEEVPITYAPVDLAKEMADLIYEGNGKQAKFLLARAWPANKPGKAAFSQAFYSELAKGAFHKEQSALNRLCAKG